MRSGGISQNTARTLPNRVELDIVATCDGWRNASHRNEAERCHVAACAFLDRHEIPELRDSLPTGNSPVAGGRGVAWKT